MQRHTITMITPWHHKNGFIELHTNNNTQSRHYLFLLNSGHITNNTPCTKMKILNEVIKHVQTFTQRRNSPIGIILTEHSGK